MNHKTTTKKRVTLDDLHTYDLDDLLQNYADQAGLVPDNLTDFRAMRAAGVRQFRQVTEPRLQEAISLLDGASESQLSLPSHRRALENLVRTLRFVLQKIESEDGEGLEQFGPLKRSMNEAIENERF